MIWNTSELSALHLSRATAISVVDCCQFGPSWMFGLKMELMVCAGLVGGTTEESYLFYWPYMIVSMIWNTSETFSIPPQPCHSHFSCWFLLIWPKLNFWAENGAYGLCGLGWRYNGAKLFFSWPYIIVSMIINTYELSPSNLSRATAIFVVDWCQFGPSWMFGLKMELMVCAGLVGGTT